MMRFANYSTFSLKRDVSTRQDFVSDVDRLRPTSSIYAEILTNNETGFTTKRRSSLASAINHGF